MKRSVTIYTYYDDVAQDGFLLGSTKNHEPYGCDGVYTVDKDAPAQWPAKITYRPILRKRIGWHDQRYRVVIRKTKGQRRAIVVDMHGQSWTVCFLPDEWDGYWVTRTEVRQ